MKNETNIDDLLINENKFIYYPIEVAHTIQDLRTNINKGTMSNHSRFYILYFSNVHFVLK